MRDASVPLATVELAVRNGSFTEPPELNGLSHLFEHMIFKPNKAVLLYNCLLAQQIGNAQYYSRANCTETAKAQPQIGDVTYLNDADQLNVYNGANAGRSCRILLHDDQPVSDQRNENA